VAAVWATGELWLRVPETIRVDLQGALRPGVTAKDLGLWLLKLPGAGGRHLPRAGVRRAGGARLSLESRMVIPNLMAESGAKNAYLEPDAVVFDWLAARLARRTGGPSPVPRAEIAAGALYPDARATISSGTPSTWEASSRRSPSPTARPASFPLSR
jgi:3-isopropylmalate/(R)-2-methylmalate dehydratase large subunit